MTHPTETDAREYLDNLDPWDLEDQIRAIDPDDTLDPWDLDAALVASALHYLQTIASLGRGHMTTPTGWLCGCGNGSLLGDPPPACPLCGFVFELPDYIDID